MKTPRTRFYTVRGEHREWARFWLTDDGCLSIISDFGNFGYWWGAAGCEFREFLIGCDDYYVSRKLADGEREFDGRATEQVIREHILHARRDGSLSRDEARDEWDLLGHLDHPGDFAEWREHTEFFDARDSYELAVYSVPSQLKHFMQRLWPLFIQQLRAELQAEAEVPPPVIGGEWIGVDLDKTLAVYGGEKQSLHIGPPVPAMLALVKDLIAQGEDVRIFTARVDGGLVALASGEPAGEAYRDVAAIRAAIEAWCVEHVGKALPITNIKDYGMKLLYDDKAVQVEPNTGRLIGDTHG